MNPRTVRAAAAAVGVAATLLAPAGRVGAQAVRHEDARGDVVRVDATTGRAAPAPDQSNGDITGVRLGHAAMVSAVVRFVDLRRAGLDRLDVLQVATDEGLRRTVTLKSESGDWAGTATMTTADGHAVGCAGLLHAIDYDADSVTVQVPRTCLSMPRWVRLGFASATLTTSDAASAAVTTDDALRDRPVGTADTGARLSTRIPLSRG